MIHTSVSLQSMGTALPLSSVNVGLRTNELIRIQKFFATGETRRIEFVIATPVAVEMDQCHVG